jgi:hypothetical protein
MPTGHLLKGVARVKIDTGTAGKALLAGGATLLAVGLTAPSASAVTFHSYNRAKCVESKTACVEVSGQTRSDAKNWRIIRLVSARKAKGYNSNKTYMAHWTYKKPGGTTKTSKWKKATNYKNVAIVNFNWDQDKQLPKNTIICIQFKGGPKACVKLT